MSPGQTGHITGQMGHIPETDGTHTRGCPAKILYVYWFFLSPYILSTDDLGDFSLDCCGKPSMLEADDFWGACCRKAMTPKKAIALLFPRRGTRYGNSASTAKKPPKPTGKLSLF